MPEAEPKETTRPKVFLSYSWSDEALKAWVLTLANRLTSEFGIEVIMDRWHLKGGHDKYHFMERMVTDPTVDKVLCICDPVYADKADGRRGGVGTETTIITPQVYKDVQQEKFVPVIARLHESGEAPLPVYLMGRKYHDLSDESNFERELEELARYIWGRPSLVPPPLGPLPTFLGRPSDQRPAPHASHLRAFTNSARSGTPQQAKGRGVEFLESWNTVFDRLILSDGKFEGIEKGIEEYYACRPDLFTYFRDSERYLERYSPMKDFRLVLQHGLDALERDGLSNRVGHKEPLRFAMRDLVVTFVALTLSGNRDEALELLRTPLRGASKPEFFLWEFDTFLDSYEAEMKRRSPTPYFSFLGQAVYDRTQKSPFPVNFERMMETDLVLFLSSQAGRRSWFPRLLFYAERGAPFPLFRQAETDPKLLLSLMDATNLSEFFEKFDSRAEHLSTLSGPAGVNLDILMNRRTLER